MIFGAVLRLIVDLDSVLKTIREKDETKRV